MGGSCPLVSGTTNRQVYFLQGSCLPYILVFESFFMQMNIAVHRHISLKCVGFYQGPLYTAVCTRVNTGSPQVTRPHPSQVENIIRRITVLNHLI